MKHAPAAALWALVAAGFGGGCGASQALQVADGSARASAAGVYATEVHGPAVRGELGAEAVHSLVQSVALATGGAISGDARLAELAGRASFTPWDAEQLGLVELAPEAHRFAAPSLEALASALREQLPAVVAGAGFTHYGARLTLGDDGAVLDLVLSRRPLRLEPVARRVEVGTRLRFRGALVGYRDAELVHFGPAGGRAALTAGTGERFDVRLPIEQHGVHVIELTAVGPEGRQLLARLRVHAGVEPAPGHALADDTVSDAARLRSTVLTRINQARAAEGLAALQAQEVLDTITARHARAWLEARRQGRPLQQLAGPAERARAAGLAGGLARELLVSAESEAQLAQAVLAEPASRASVLSLEATHLGLGAARDPENGQWTLAGLVVQLAPTLDATEARRRLLALLNAARRARGAAALAPDPQLEAVASAQAGSFFSITLPTEAQTVAAVNAGLEGVRLRYRRTEALMVVARSIEEAATLEPALAADVQGVGIGVAQGDRPDTGPRSLAVVIVLAWAR